jgi:single-strand DNA-binding protein
MNLNKVILGGRLCADPEVKYTKNGIAISNVRLAINTLLGKDKETRERRKETCFVNGTAFAGLAETIGKFFKKGDPILVEGRLRYRTWEDQEGNKRSIHDILISSFSFVSSGTPVEKEETEEVEAEDKIPF